MSGLKGGRFQRAATQVGTPISGSFQGLGLSGLGVLRYFPQWHRAWYAKMMSAATSAN